MKIKVGVFCQYWNRPDFTEFDMPDGSTEAEIEEAARVAAFELSRLEWWIENETD